MAKSSPTKLEDERRLLLPLVSAECFEAPSIAPIGERDKVGSSGTISSNSWDNALRAFKVFSTYG
jgi:hypothetical protein